VAWRLAEHIWNNLFSRFTISKMKKFIFPKLRIRQYIDFGVNITAQGFSVEDTMTDDSYFDISEIKLSITSLFSVQIMSYLWVLDIIYSDIETRIAGYSVLDWRTLTGSPHKYVVFFEVVAWKMSPNYFRAKSHFHFSLITGCELNCHTWFTDILWILGTRSWWTSWIIIINELII